MSKHVVSGRDETVRLFENPVLEYFSHINPATPIVVFMPLIAWVLVSSNPRVYGWSYGAAILAGIILWTVTEYTIHRWAFHLEPQSSIGKRLHFLVHGIHHAYPRDSTRLVMPPLISLPLAGGFYLLFEGVLAPYHQPVWIGFILGYVAYDTIHYAVHHMNLTSRIGRRLKQHHMHHHFVNPDRAYGVSNPFWDRIFATLPERPLRVSARRRKLVQFLQRHTSNGTQHTRHSQRRKSSRI